MPYWPCATWPVISGGRKDGLPSGRSGASRRRPSERTGRFVPLRLGPVPPLLGRWFFPQPSLPPPLSRRPRRSVLQSRRPSSLHPHCLNPLRCVLLLPTRGDALSSAVVPLSRAILGLQKSHAHPKSLLEAQMSLIGNRRLFFK